MASSSPTVPNIIIVAAESLPTQPWWRDLHSAINISFQNKDILAFPPSWARLPIDPDEGAERLKEELGPEGVIAVVLVGDSPIACAGALPFRGPNWVNDERSADDTSGDVKAVKRVSDKGSTITEGGHDPEPTVLLDRDPTVDWEICCCCIHPEHRKSGLSRRVLQVLIDHIKTLGAKRLLTNYVIEETGQYWPHMGFETVPGAGGVLKKGFTHTKGMEGLRADIHYGMGVKNL